MECLERFQKYILGIDTSNYKTSFALIGREDIISDRRKFLRVKQGERGLRQSDALFQHIQNLPELFDELSEAFGETVSRRDIAAVAYSSRPRPVAGSYMPCFLAGASFGRSLASMLDVPAISFSHQEGHIEAIRAFTEGIDTGEFIACHFSGGTCEILRIGPAEKTSRKEHKNDINKGYHLISGENTIYTIDRIGGSKDISFGQVLDRAGVEMGFGFPCGQSLDEIAVRTEKGSRILTPVKVQDCRCNLSGIDTQIRNRLQDTDRAGRPALIREIFEKISDAVVRMLTQASEKSGLCDIVMSGGVSTSGFIRAAVREPLAKKRIRVSFDDRNLSADNAVGTALLGGKYIWD